MRTLLPETLAAIADRVAGVAQLVDMDLPIPWRVNTSKWPLTWNGRLYLATHGVGRIEEIDDTPNEIKGVKFELPALIDAELAEAIAGQPQGRAVTIYTAIFRSDTWRITEAVVDFAGRLDTFQIAESDELSSIQATAENIGIDLLRPCNIRYTQGDQQRLHPGDNSFEFVVDQVDREIVFPAASWGRR